MATGEILSIKVEVAEFDSAGSVPSCFFRSESMASPLSLAGTEWNKAQHGSFTMLSAASEAALTKPAGDLIAMVLTSDVPFYFRPASGDQRVASRVHVLLGTRTYPVVASGSYGFLVQPIAALGNCTVQAWFYTYEAPA